VNRVPRETTQKVVKMTAEEFGFERPLGRRIRVRHEGHRRDPLLIYHHGSPSTRLDISYVEERSTRHGIHIAAFDRPGYGRSDYHPFTLESLADDTVAVAEALGRDRFAVLGFSSGAAAAVATAAFHPGRVSALVICGGAAPYPDVPEEWAELTDAEKKGLALADSDENEAARLLAEPDRPFVDVLGGDDASVLDLWRSVLGPADRRMLDDPGFSSFWVRVQRESLRQGQQGWARENVVRMARWNVDFGAIDAQAALWYGEEDTVVFGRWLKRKIPQADLLVLPEAGHLAMFEHWDVIVTDLIQRSPT
jgi:pimeloyl-ACP methyl ester carboxylesterase